MRHGLLLQVFSHTEAFDVVRASGASLKTANTEGSALTINSVEDYEGNYYDGTAAWDYASRSIGAVGNSLKVIAIDSGANQQLVIGNSLAGGARSRIFTREYSWY